MCHTNNKPRSLLELLRTTRRTKATDPRDKVYALLGLADEEMFFEVDYEKDVRDVFTNVARYLLRHPNSRADIRGPLILACVEHYEDDREDGWPSWPPK